MFFFPPGLDHCVCTKYCFVDCVPLSALFVYIDYKDAFVRVGVFEGAVCFLAEVAVSFFIIISNLYMS